MNDRPRILDLFCGAGGAAVGYHRAGFDVVGADIRPQPHYPFEFHQADAMTFPLDGYDAIHASPPCQDHSVSKSLRDGSHGTGWMLEATIERLRASGGVPWVVENVGGARRDMGGSWTVLCGSSFGLGVIRHRLFASSELLMASRCDHSSVAAPLSVFGHGEDNRTCDRYESVYGKRPGHEERAAAMGIGWMTRDELVQAIPPAFTENIGSQILEAIA